MSKINLKNAKLVEKRKTWFLIPAIIVAVAIIFGVIYGFVFGNPLNLSMDFSGGYSLTVVMGPTLDDDSQPGYEDTIRDVFSGLADGNGAPYGLEVESFARQGTGEKLGLYVKYKAVEDATDSQMEVINEELEDALLSALFVGDVYSGRVVRGDSVSASVSSELLITAICAVLLAIVLMLIYIAIRFELLSGISSVICLTHDLIIMFAFMLIFRVPVSSTFIAALITILGYSINNTIIIFDRVRDIMKTNDGMNMTYAQIANNAVTSTLVRSINTTATTFITVFMVALFSIIFAVEEMIFFCIPLMVGLIAGTFSSLLLAPSIWTMWKERLAKKFAKHPDIPATPADMALAEAPIVENELSTTPETTV